MFIRAVAIATLTLIAPSAQAASSAYSVLNFDDGSCKPLGPAASKQDEEMGVVSLVCPGYKGYPVVYDENDERTSVHFGDPAKATTRAGWESFMPFNSAALRVEWRIDADGVPYAAIQRHMISTGDGNIGAAKGQVLVISKVGQPNGPAGCVVGLVDAIANKNGNLLARKLADELAPTFQCGKDKAVYHEKRGDKAADFDAHFEQ